MELDRVPLWREDRDVSARQLVEDFARYLYLPRLRDATVLVGAIRDGLGLISWEQDSFAYADSYDQTARRYRRLRAGESIAIYGTEVPGLLVRPQVAKEQLAAEAAASSRATATPGSGAGSTDGAKASAGDGRGAPAAVPQPTEIVRKRFHGTVALDPQRVGRDASRIADEVISHLSGLEGSEVTVTLEIEARMSDGTPEKVVRTVTENCRTLKFSIQGFEEE
jgi:hypothetical protein